MTNHPERPCCRGLAMNPAETSPAAPLKVFVSGDMNKLAAERTAAVVAIDDVRLTPIYFENFPAATTDPRSFYLQELTKCQIYLGLFGDSYSPGTIDEYRFARNHDIPRLAFIKYPTQRDSKLTAFIGGELRTDITYDEFGSPEGLQKKIQLALQREVQRQQGRQTTLISRRTNTPLLESTLLSIITQRGAAYLRELQVNLEDHYVHWQTFNLLRRLVESGTVNSRMYKGLRWYYQDRWQNLASRVESKAALVGTYAHFDNRFNANGVAYDDYSEFLLDEAFQAAGFEVLQRNVTSPRSEDVAQRTRGRPRDIDFLVLEPNSGVRLGVQLKNRLDYPKKDTVLSFLNQCSSLSVSPLFVTRMAPENLLAIIQKSGGFLLVYKRWLLRPGFPRESFQHIVRELGLPLGVYQRTPDFLIVRLQELKNRLAG
jgi:Domain of unknown function (DUF4062)